MKRTNKIFLTVSIVLLLSDCLFVWLNYSTTQKALQESYDQVGQQLQSAFNTALSATEMRMLQISTFLSNDQRVQELFNKGRLAVEEEGGGPGGEKSALVRKSLYDLVGPSRDILAEQFSFRQLHFHLGPGSVSFLRAHKPGKFGDRMDDVRHTIVVSNAEKISTTGFETGRIVSGIRGVSPVFLPGYNGGEPVHIGALEAGTAFKTMLSFLRENEDAHFAVLLSKSHLKENIWPEILEKRIALSPPIDGYMIEATTSEDTKKILAGGLLKHLQATDATQVVEYRDISYAVTGFPLRDFLGKRESERSDVGMVVVWRDVSHDQALFWRSTLNNVFFALVGFLIIEIILFWGIRASSRKLEQVIEEAKAELLESNNTLKEHIEERKQAEKEKIKMQARLLQAQKLESVGQLAAGIAHEVNTPAQYVKANIVFFEESFEDLKMLIDSYEKLLAANKEEGRSADIIAELESFKDEIDLDFLAEEIPVAIKQSKEGIDKVSHIIKAMKEFSHSGSREKVPSDINNILSNTITISRNEWKDVATLTADYSVSMPLVPCCSDELGQVFLNILLNAVDAIRVRFTEEEQGREGEICISTKESEDAVEIRVQDNGAGIPEDIQLKVFDPFFTTKEVGEGTGQGMSIARDVVEKMHSGKLSFQTTKGEGTTFIISLPLIG